MLGAEWHCRIKGEQRSKVGVIIMADWCCCILHTQTNFTHWLGGILHTQTTLPTGWGHTENPDIGCVPFAGHTAGHSGGGCQVWACSSSCDPGTTRQLCLVRNRMGHSQSGYKKRKEKKRKKASITISIIDEARHRNCLKSS